MGEIARGLNGKNKMPSWFREGLCLKRDGGESGNIRDFGVSLKTFGVGCK